jgi:hypothetical protein
MNGTNAIICGLRFYNSSSDNFTCNEGLLNNHFAPTSYFDHSTDKTLNYTTNSINYSGTNSSFSLTWSRRLSLNGTFSGEYDIGNGSMAIIYSMGPYTNGAPKYHGTNRGVSIMTISTASFGIG